MMQIPLEAKRLILRDFEEADWEAVHRYASFDCQLILFTDLFMVYACRQTYLLGRAHTDRPQQPRG